MLMEVKEVLRMKDQKELKGKKNELGSPFLMMMVPLVIILYEL
jgi:hypothetical protein